MKFVLNGGLIIGTVDGANIEIGREVGEENMYFFGHLAEAVDDLRHNNNYRGVKLDKKLASVFAAIEKGMFGDASVYQDLISSIRDHGDYYIVSSDFSAYTETQAKINRDFRDKKAWIAKSIIAVANMGFFSSDRAVDEYAETIWNVEPCKVTEEDVKLD
jgi:starch phosphorylase